MHSAAPYAYMKSKPTKSASMIKKEQLHGLHNLEEDIDLNIFALKFENLKEVQKSMGVGDPFFCSKCKACFNSFSKLYTKTEYEEKFLKAQEKVEKEEEIKEKVEQPKIDLIEEVPKNGSVWICQFCETHNTLIIEKEQVPTKEDMVYLLESFNQKLGSESDNASTVIFCIDNSGSMNSTTEITGKVDLKHGLSQKQLEMLKMFMEPGDEAQLINNQGKTFISRKQCVMAAIESQLNEIAKNDPQKRVGLITFNNEVVVFGDCSQDPTNILGDKLDKTDIILNDIAPLKVEKTVKQSFDKIIQNFNRIEASGATALGPAILSAIELASKGKIGSTVVICTDGLSNIGVGNFEGSLEQSQKFYTQLAEKAKLANLAINIVSIKGEGCKLQTLSILAKQTNGNISLVSPDEIESKFSNMLKDEIVATQVEVKIRLHKGVEFRNEFPENLHQEGTVLVKKLANATVKTKIAFEYQLKPEPILKDLGIDINKLKVLPFQAQIVYTTTEGHKFIRVVTSTLNTTTDKKLIEDQADKINIIHDRVGQQTAFMVQQKKYAGFADYNNNYNQYIQKNIAENLSNVGQVRMKRENDLWMEQKNEVVMNAGLSKARKEEIQIQKMVEVVPEKILELEKEEKEIEMNEDMFTEAVHRNFK